MIQKYYIGWDVGAWNCDKNKSSRDALVIIDAHQNVVSGKRTNVKNWLNEAKSTYDILERIFEHCGKQYHNEDVILAIDTPLGFSKGFVDLITNYASEKHIDEFYKNPYLFRETEMFLSEIGKNPLSAVNHMIGAQATKGIHFISKYAPNIASIGVWKSNDGKLTVIETYPGANKSKPSNELADEDQDIQDALICAQIAKVFDQNPEKLYKPTEDIWEKEGWIWFLEEKIN